MIAGYDPAIMKLSWFEVSDMWRRAVVHRKVKHLVEVAIVLFAIPSNR